MSLGIDRRRQISTCVGRLSMLLPAAVLPAGSADASQLSQCSEDL